MCAEEDAAGRALKREEEGVGDYATKSLNFFLDTTHFSVHQIKKFLEISDSVWGGGPPVPNQKFLGNV